MNLPNAITVGRILIAPLIAVLPFVTSPTVRLAAFVIYIVAAVSDYVDGKLARTHDLVTELGSLLDPFADKLLLLATFIPMFVLMSPRNDPLAPTPDAISSAHGFPFITPFGEVGLSWWIVAIVLGRELFMTVFRQLAARRGVVISAIGAAKWKTGFQYVWVGAAYFWFFAVSLATANGWTGDYWRAFAYFNGAVGVVTMLSAVVLTIYSLALYVQRYGRVFAT